MNATLINTQIPESANKPGRVGLPRAWSINDSVQSPKLPFTNTGLHLRPSASRLRPPASSARRGLSLLEVLVSVFVLTLGLMGIAMVIPAGNALMSEALKSDRASACGRAALGEVQIRRLHDSSLWLQKWWPSTGVTALAPARISSGAMSPFAPGMIYGETYFLDPRFYVYVIDPYATPDPLTNATRDSVRTFPYSPHPEREFALWGGAPRFWPDRARARRATLLDHVNAGPVYVPISEYLADRLTTWADELIFSLEADAQRPRQTYSWLNDTNLTIPSENSAFPILPGDKFDSTNKIPIHPAGEGGFTWSVMITPIVPLAYRGTFTSMGGGVYPQVDPTLIGQWDHDGGGGTLPVPVVNPDRITRYEISVVVFHKRNLYCPEGSDDAAKDELRNYPDLEVVRERSVYAQIVGGGVGGGDVILFVPDGDASRPPGYLDVRKDDWIMLKALDRGGFVGDTNDPSIGKPNRSCIPTYPTVCKWYRVVGVDELQTGVSFYNPQDPDNPLTGRQRYVTLAGPDWQVDTTPFTNGFNPVDDIAEAALVKDVVGVFTTTIDINAL